VRGILPLQNLSISNNFACLIFIFLPWNSARLVAALEKMAGSNAEYVRDGEPFSKGGQPNAGSLKSTDVTDVAG
jgi:hypothetical protein